MPIGGIGTKGALVRLYPRVDYQMFTSLVSRFEFFVAVGTLEIPWLMISPKMGVEPSLVTKAGTTMLTHELLLVAVFHGHMDLQLDVAGTFGATVRTDEASRGRMVKLKYVAS